MGSLLAAVANVPWAVIVIVTAVVVALLAGAAYTVVKASVLWTGHGLERQLQRTVRRSMRMWRSATYRSERRKQARELAKLIRERRPPPAQ